MSINISIPVPIPAYTACPEMWHRYVSDTSPAAAETRLDFHQLDCSLVGCSNVQSSLILLFGDELKEFQDLRFVLERSLDSISV